MSRDFEGMKNSTLGQMQDPAYNQGYMNQASKNQAQLVPSLTIGNTLTELQSLLEDSGRVVMALDSFTRRLTGRGSELFASPQASHPPNKLENCVLDTLIESTNKLRSLRSSLGELVDILDREL